MTDSSCAAVNQHALTRLQLSRFEQRIPGGDRGDWNCRRSNVLE
jgi:hypothetical protein